MSGLARAIGRLHLVGRRFGRLPPPMDRVTAGALRATRWIVCGWLCISIAGAASVVFPAFSAETAAEYARAVAAANHGELAFDADHTFALARTLHLLGQTEEALRLARRALAMDPARADIHVFVGDIFVALDRLDQAELSFRHASELEPALPGVQRRLGLTLDRLGHRRAAEQAFALAVAQQPDDGTARLLLGRLYLDTNRPREALEELIRACDLDPSSANPRYALAQAQIRLGERDEARRSLEQFNVLKRQEQAAADERNLARDDERQVRDLVAALHTDLAGIWLDHGRQDRAEAHLRQATGIAPHQPLAYRWLASLLFQTGRAAAARPMLEDWVRLQPDSVTGRVNLGTLLLELGEHESAVEHLRSALRLDPDQPQALNNLTRFLLKDRRDLGEALDYGRRLARVQPTAASFDLLGWAAHANGLPEEARAALARAVELDPNQPVYRERWQRLGGTP